MPEEKTEEQENDRKGLFDIRLIIVGVAIIILASGIAYVVAKMVVNPAIAPDDNDPGISKTLGPIYELDEFTVNLADSGGRRFVKTSMVFVISSNSLRRELDEKRPLIRDRIILLLGEKTINEMESAAGKEQLKQEILVNINPLLVTGQVEEIYFNSFVFN